jgi:hypothetical protein
MEGLSKGVSGPGSKLFKILTAILKDLTVRRKVFFPCFAQTKGQFEGDASSRDSFSVEDEGCVT